MIVSIGWDLLKFFFLGMGLICFSYINFKQICQFWILYYLIFGGRVMIDFGGFLPPKLSFNQHLWLCLWILLVRVHCELMKRILVTGMTPWFHLWGGHRLLRRNGPSHIRVSFTVTAQGFSQEIKFRSPLFFCLLEILVLFYEFKKKGNFLLRPGPWWPY